VYKELVKLFNSRNIDLKIFIDKKPLIYKGDYRQLRLVFRELLQNALKFTPDGGKVRARLELKNNEIVYTVQDTGVGIPFEKQHMIFEKFYEIQDVINHRSSKQDFMGGGMGIGLSLVKEIVEAMKGKILLESDPGNGSKFTSTLPLPQTKLKGENDVSTSPSLSFSE
jgi:signal transduction histidine kinase